MNYEQMYKELRDYIASSAEYYESIGHKDKPYGIAYGSLLEMCKILENGEKVESKIKIMKGVICQAQSK